MLCSLMTTLDFHGSILCTANLISLNILFIFKNLLHASLMLKFESFKVMKVGNLLMVSLHVTWSTLASAISLLAQKLPNKMELLSASIDILLNLGLIMMFHARLSSHFWVECFSTTAFLINKLPSPHLKMDSPFFWLFGKHPDYSTF